MNGTPFSGLVQNAALLLAVAFLFDVAASRWRTVQSSFRQAPVGLALGAIGIAVMLTPWTFGSGIVFDTRSVLLGISGLFFGPVSTAIAVAMTAVFRYYLGGTGVWTGIGVILCSGAIGIAWRRFRRQPLAEISWRELYLFGIAIHLAMLGMMLTLPWGTALRVLSDIALPVIVIYPPGTALLGVLMVNRMRREQAEEKLRESEENYRNLFENAGEAIYVTQDGKLVFVNPATARMSGYSAQDLMSRPFIEFVHPDDREMVIDRYVRRMRGETVPSLYTFRIVRRGGTTRWVALNTVMIRWQGKAATLNFLSDITEREQREKALSLHVARTQALLDLHLMATESQQTILGFALEAAQQACASQFSFVGLIDETESLMTVHAWSKTTTAQCASADKPRHFPIAEAGVWGDCVRQRKAVMINDDDAPRPGRKGYPAGHVPVRRFLGIPIFDGDKVVAVVAVANKKDDYTEDDVNAAVSLMNQMWGILRRSQDEKRLQESLELLRRAMQTTIEVLVLAIETKDPYTAGHQRRATNLARAIAQGMKLSPERIEGIRMAGRIHDIGKLSVPSEILSKPTPLSEIEFSLIKEHAKSGYEILKDVASPWPLAEIVYQHHERIDGSGYPRGLKGEEILIEARILAVADVVEAMASYRPYRPALGIEAALAEIEKNRGTLYDPVVADTCLRLFREKKVYLEQPDLKW